MKIKDHCHDHIHDEVSVIGELVCHLPYAIYSASIGLIVLSFLAAFSFPKVTPGTTIKSLHGLFHSFHYLHIIFAATGSLVTFSRFSKNLWKGFFVALVSAAVFCTLSDIILPYLAGRMLGIPMHFHLCFVKEFQNIMPFLAIGLVNGLIMSYHTTATKGVYAIFSHFAHILTSTMASLFYLASEGFSTWQDHMGLIFVLLIIAVVVPCTFADVIVPIFFARPRNLDEKYQAHQHKKEL